MSAADTITAARDGLAELGYTTQAHGDAVVVIAEQAEAPSKRVIGIGDTEADAYTNALTQARRGWAQ